MDKYEVTLLNPNYETEHEQEALTSRRTLVFTAENFAHAEQQAEQYVERGELIAEIKRDW